MVGGFRYSHGLQQRDSKLSLLLKYGFSKKESSADANTASDFSLIFVTLHENGPK